jgi:hypothetical protein
VFAVFATLSMQDFKQMGVGLAVAVALDATVIRIVLLPAIMTVLGERNWPNRRAVRPGEERNGVSDGNRTRDNRDHNPVLYQLSYTHHAGRRNDPADGV